MNARHLAKAKRNDVLAKWGITLGGISIIGSMLVMILFMAKVTFPLFGSAKQELRGHMELSEKGDDIALFAPGPYLERGFAVRENGEGVFFDLAKGTILEKFTVEPPVEGSRIVASEGRGKETFNLYWDEGSISEIEAHFKPVFDDDGNRTITFHSEVIATIAALEDAVPGPIGVLRQIDEGSFWAARLLTGNKILLRRTTVEEDFMGDITEEHQEGILQVESRGKLMTLLGDTIGSRLYAGTEAGELLAWDISNPEEPVLLDNVQVSDSPVTALTLLFGNISVIVGDEMGNLSAWNLMPGAAPEMIQLHEFKPHKAKITKIAPSYKDKSFVSMDAEGTVHFNHLTSERKLLTLKGGTPFVNFALAERGDGFVGRTKNGDFWVYDISIPHPEISWKTLWGKVWYEGYPEPVHAWQSSSASDDFEPKMSLMPLLFGSLKGTFYGMMFSLPLAFFAAVYTSYMMAPRWRSVIKPVVELMAAIPSVVTGFLAALWLAPRLESNLTGMVIALMILPLVGGLGLYAVFRMKRKLIGTEFLWCIPFLLVAMWVSWQAGYLIQDTFFDGNLNLWFFQALGLSVDQRNCVVIGFALGFAVIPIIFTISEDALYNVPKHMSAAALALGSSRWQTMRRVILPMATPGIFAATMIGFGRAVGETMIVLMATGNTPIMSPSILNGMRTLSANIAVEIPEAPVNSTLYRVLFLSAVLLFSMTFIVNTAAEVVRVRLHKKYKNM